MLSAAAFVVFCLFCSAMAFIRHPIFGLYFYLASIYVHPPSRWWGYMLPDLRWALLSAGVTVLAVALAMYFVANWFARPIKLLRESMTEITHGRFEHRIREQRKDEYGVLYSEFNQMAQALQEGFVAAPVVANVESAGADAVAPDARN